MTHTFTGRHAAIILVAFFTVVIGVNATMARFAVSTFSGTVVDNSYVASQEYNGWLAKARRQRALGWHVTLSLDAGRRVTIAAGDRSGRALDGLRARAVARHPLGAIAPVTLGFTGDGRGQLVATQPLPAGRWIVDATLTSQASSYRLEEDLQ